MQMVRCAAAHPGHVEVLHCNLLCNGTIADNMPANVIADVLLLGQLAGVVHKVRSVGWWLVHAGEVHVAKAQAGGLEGGQKLVHCTQATNRQQ
jgi:hypothetical protein